MSWHLTEDAKKIIDDLHMLEFYAILPNGKRVPIDSLCKEYAMDPTGTVCKTYLDRLVLVIEAWWPEKEIWDGNWSQFSQSITEKAKLYWRQAFYLSTGTSNPISVSYMELMRRNIWMPFNGLQLTNPSEQKKLKNELKWGEENPEYIYTPGTVVEFPYRDSLWLMKPFCMKDIFNTGMFGNDATVKLRNLFTGYTLSEEDLKKANSLFDTFDPFLPEGFYYQSHKDHVSDRFKSISYILASIALGGESYEKGLHLRDGTINSFFFGGDFPKNRALLEICMQRNPLKECFKHPEELPPTSFFDINNYIARNRATQVDNLFRSINLDVDFDILKDSSVMIDSINRPMPITDIFRACAKRISKAFLLFSIKKIEKEDIATILAEPLVDFLEKSTFSSANNVRFTYKLRNGNKNFIPIGGRKKTRNVRKRAKRTRHTH